MLLIEVVVSNHITIVIFDARDARDAIGTGWWRLALAGDEQSWPQSIPMLAAHHIYCT